MAASRNKIYLFLISGVLILSTLLYKNYAAQKYSVSDALNYYGFSDAQQKEAFQNLLRQSSILMSHQSLENVFPVRETPDQLAVDLLTLVKETQEKFVLRSGTKERWEIKPLEWMTQDKEKTLENLRILGFKEAIEPKQKEVDAICILGATASRMTDRIEYADKLIQKGLKTKAVILLAGERYVTQDVDGTTAELENIAKTSDVSDWKKLTETHLIQHAYQTSPLSQKGLEVYTIDTPKRDLPRPTTQTTILELIAWLKDHPDIKKIAFVSNQPYVKYQQAVISSILKEKKSDLKYEVIGSASDSNDPHALIEGLGSYIWAVTPEVLSAMGIHLTNPEIQKAFKDRYAKHPLIYAILPSSLGS